MSKMKRNETVYQPLQAAQHSPSKGISACPGQKHMEGGEKVEARLGDCASPYLSHPIVIHRAGISSLRSTDGLSILEPQYERATLAR